MTDSALLELCRHAFTAALLCSGPILGTVLVIGVVVSIVQAVTQVQEATLTFLPKLLGAGLVTVLGGAWMLDQLVGLAQQCFSHTGWMIR
ncbi:MAG: flagellar biosynthetic protein FliQ [Armatimonadota bacterium]